MLRKDLAAAAPSTAATANQRPAGSLLRREPAAQPSDHAGAGPDGQGTPLKSLRDRLMQRQR
jgi:hypothetical protein